MGDERPEWYILASMTLVRKVNTTTHATGLAALLFFIPVEWCFLDDFLVPPFFFCVKRIL